MRQRSHRWTKAAAATVIGLILAGLTPSTADAPAAARTWEAYARRPLSFEPNHGQADGRVRFLSRGQGYMLFLTPSEAAFSLARQPRSETNTSAAVRIELVGANCEARMEGLEKLPGTVNYFIGNDPKRWWSGIPTYAKVRHANVYPGVDLVYYSNQGHLEFDFVVAPGADPGQITLRFAGADRLHLDRDGDLVLQTLAAQIRLRKLLAYQEVNGARRKVAGHYRLDAPSRVTFQVGAYDPTRPLIIDPLALIYSTFLGGSSDPWSNQDSAHGIAVDPSGAAYIAGATTSTDFPLASPAQPIYGGGTFDAFVAKFDPNGKLVYSTFLGGSIHDTAAAIAIDADGKAYVAGFTSSPNFPTVNPFQAVKNGANDGFVTVLTPSGSALVYSTYLGGSGGESTRGVALFSKLVSKSVPPLPQRPVMYVTGNTNSSNFPTKNAFQPTISGPFADDAFVTILDPSRPPATQLVYSTFLGGSGSEEGHSIAVDPTGNAYVTGGTTSTNFPTKNAFQPGLTGLWDAFVSKLDPSKPPAAQMVYSTYLGGSMQDRAHAIAADAAGNLHVTGYTISVNFPIKNAFQPVNSGLVDVFVTKLDPSKPPAGQLVYSTYLGGLGSDTGRGIAVDGSGNISVTGDTTSSDFPALEALQPGNSGGYDAFVARLDPSKPPAGQLVYSSYLGEIYNDFGFAIARGAPGSVYVVGATASPDFPTKNAWQPVKGARIDAFVTRIRE